MAQRTGPGGGFEALTTMTVTASLRKIMLTDYAAFLAALFPVGMWVVYLVLGALGRLDPTDPVFPALSGLVTLAGLGMLAWRVRLIAGVINTGMTTEATISQITFFRDRGRITYLYTFQGQKLVSGNAVMRTGPTTALKVGQVVTVAVDPNQPKRAFIRALYV